MSLGGRVFHAEKQMSEKKMFENKNKPFIYITL